MTVATKPVSPARVGTRAVTSSTSWDEARMRLARGETVPPAVIDAAIRRVGRWHIDPVFLCMVQRMAGDLKH